jgi:hypothetical protein
MVPKKFSGINKLKAKSTTKTSTNDPQQADRGRNYGSKARREGTTPSISTKRNQATTLQIKYSSFVKMAPNYRGPSMTSASTLSSRTSTIKPSTRSRKTFWLAFRTIHDVLKTPP